MHNELTQVIQESGLWTGAREESHAFLLSPSVYRITQDQQMDLQKLGFAIQNCLAGLSHISVIANDAGLNYSEHWLYARRIFSSGVPKVYHELQGLNVKHTPKLLKVDLMVDQAGRFKIAEIDGHNKHGLGYSTLAMRFRNALYSREKTLPGVVSLLSSELKRLGYDKIKLFYADRERFYLPEFEVAQQEFLKHDINCVIASESDVSESFLMDGIFLDLPLLYDRQSLYQTIIPAYKNGDVEFIIPPKPFLGAKGVLALLRNDTQDESLEALLITFIKKQSLELVRQYIPETFLIGKQAQGMEFIQERISNKNYILKESISGGMKGTVFSHEDCFDGILAKACSTKMNWILQEEVINQPQTFSWFDRGSSEVQVANDWLMRVVVHFVSRQMGDITVTACREKAVHGGKNCLQIGTIIV